MQTNKQITFPYFVEKTEMMDGNKKGKKSKQGRGNEGEGGSEKGESEEGGNYYGSVGGGIKGKVETSELK